MTCRPYRGGDERAIIGLARIVYPHLALDLDGWNWRYRDNPAGQALIELAWDEEALVGHYAVCPVLMNTGGHEELTYLSLLTMIHPDWRGRGLFQELAKRTYRRTAPYPVWGFPNQHSHRGFVRDLGWADIYEIPMLRLWLDDQIYSHLHWNVIEVSGFDERFDDLWQGKYYSIYKVMARRDCSYLQWRYVHNPMESYRILAYVTDNGRKILGYLVFKRYEGEYQVMDLLAQSVEVGTRLVESLIWMAFQDTVSPESIALWLNVGDPLHHALEKMGFCNDGPVTYFGARIHPPWQNLPVYRDWYIMMGDSDVF